MSPGHEYIEEGEEGRHRHARPDSHKLRVGGRHTPGSRRMHARGRYSTLLHSRELRDSDSTKGSTGFLVYARQGDVCEEGEEEILSWTSCTAVIPEPKRQEGKGRER